MSGMFESRDPLDLVLEPELAPLESRQLELVAVPPADSAAISLVEPAMLGLQHFEVGVWLVIVHRHHDFTAIRPRRNGATNRGGARRAENSLKTNPSNSWFITPR